MTEWRCMSKTSKNHSTANKIMIVIQSGKTWQWRYFLSYSTRSVVPINSSYGIVSVWSLSKCSGAISWSTECMMVNLIWRWIEWDTLLDFQTLWYSLNKVLLLGFNFHYDQCKKIAETTLVSCWPLLHHVSHCLSSKKRIVRYGWRTVIAQILCENISAHRSNTDLAMAEWICLLQSVFHHILLSRHLVDWQVMLSGDSQIKFADALPSE